VRHAVRSGGDFDTKEELGKGIGGLNGSNVLTALPTSRFRFLHSLGGTGSLYLHNPRPSLRASLSAFSISRSFGKTSDTAREPVRKQLPVDVAVARVDLSQDLAVSILLAPGDPNSFAMDVVAERPPGSRLERLALLGNINPLQSDLALNHLCVEDLHGVAVCDRHDLTDQLVHDGRLGERSQE
jgi:hypothetical protein